MLFVFWKYWIRKRALNRKREVCFRLERQKKRTKKWKRECIGPTGSLYGIVNIPLVEAILPSIYHPRLTKAPLIGSSYCMKIPKKDPTAATHNYSLYRVFETIPRLNDSAAPNDTKYLKTEREKE